MKLDANTYPVGDSITANTPGGQVVGIIRKFLPNRPVTIERRELVAVPPTYKWLAVGVLAGVWLGTMEIARSEARSVNPNYLGVGTMSAVGRSSVLNDAYYQRIDWTDINNTGTDAGVKNLASLYPANPGVSYTPGETGHSGIIKLTSGTASGQNAQLQHNCGRGVATALDLSKVTRLIYRAVIKVDSLFTSYTGGGEHSWGVLSQGKPLCGAMFSIAPGFTGTDGIVAGNCIVTGTYEDATIPLMEDVSRPIFPIAPDVWYDTMIVWSKTAVKFYCRTWTADSSNPWILVGTNTQYIGTGLPVYVTRAVRCYGDTVKRSMYIDLEELYVDMSTPKRFIGDDLVNY
jgi:hypothetical protein